MNEILIHEFNSFAKENNAVYILGDIVHRTPVVEVNLLIYRREGLFFDEILDQAVGGKT